MQNKITLKSFLLLFHSNKKKILHLKRFANTVLHLKANKSKLYHFTYIYLFHPHHWGYRPSLSNRELNAWTQWGKQKCYLFSSRAKRRINYAVCASKSCLSFYNCKLHLHIGIFNLVETVKRVNHEDRTFWSNALPQGELAAERPFYYTHYCLTNRKFQ